MHLNKTIKNVIEKEINFGPFIWSHAAFYINYVVWTGSNKEKITSSCYCIHVAPKLICFAFLIWIPLANLKLPRVIKIDFFKETADENEELKSIDQFRYIKILTSLATRLRGIKQLAEFYYTVNIVSIHETFQSQSEGFRTIWLTANKGAL